MLSFLRERHDHAEPRVHMGERQESAYRYGYTGGKLDGFVEGCWLGGALGGCLVFTIVMFALAVIS